ncbi:16S rRNA processing protein RimM [Schinkia azotoformans MEV2011]|uniref:Ribosome maturation factor RimM n=2 Tax=Schinkia azotoformans TaxID=1454 RepID=K6DSV2_SCHAZ|nr:ribosome maturation factor RimM [Schinkia azotoformans]EKN63861.1 16S rRNA-processing protein RimM [Schinkia azotoformans LMG 9581]KEF39856.1 16S rRNA processing protein RimM [Schinkia azotoformans MEV2011]MEC1638275.1 ribosome maturation factor RimM [Schinkia azotoformans]MEC1697154.1 ribosome maturation factor RimM [Schinkia azotoformans]MEC1715313.1 ribosome maturation factor RimM [Schinkia azotoformans]
MAKYFNVGKIVNTQGIKGEIRVISSTDFPEERFRKGNILYIEVAPNDLIEVKVSSHRLHKNFHLLTFAGFNNINDVEKYKGKMLKISEDQLNDLDEGEFYYHEIIDCEVFTDDGEKLGTIKEILSPGANDVWVVKRPGDKDLLLPYIEDVVKEVDVENKKVIVHLMEGLL